MERPCLPEGSGGEEPPALTQAEMDQHAAEVYNARMWLFGEILEGHKLRRRRNVNDYRKKNCEETIGSRIR